MRLRPRLARRIRAVSLRVRWLAIGLIVAGLVGQVWRNDLLGDPVNPEDLQAKAAALGREMGVEVGVGSPELFQDAISSPLPDDLSLTSADARQAALALEPLRRALEVYPKQLLTFFVKGVFLAGEITVDRQFPSGGTHGDGAIYLAVGFIRGPADAREVELALHHEFSSFLYRYVGNEASLTNRWDAELAPGFQYRHTREEELRAATERAPAWNSDQWYEAGFVHDYGRSSKENDINTYAELLMADPGRLMELVGRWPRIAAKARLLARFYARIHPALAAYLRRGPAVALLDGVEDSAPAESWRRAIPDARADP